jgi:hypothetical protein
LAPRALERGLEKLMGRSFRVVSMNRGGKCRFTAW